MSVDYDSSFVDHELIAGLSRLEFEARIPVAGSFSGRHKSPFRGASIDFSQYRKYVPGDDIRAIDWRVFGQHWNGGFDRGYSDVV